MLLACTLEAWIIAPPPATAQEAGEKVNPHAATLQGFNERLKQYVALKKKLESGLPQPQPSDRTTNVEQRRTELAQRIKDARKAAKQGDLFGDAQRIFKDIIRRDAENRGAPRRPRRDAGSAGEESAGGQYGVS
jgi:hypothetical protein